MIKNGINIFDFLLGLKDSFMLKLYRPIFLILDNEYDKSDKTVYYWNSIQLRLDDEYFF